LAIRIIFPSVRAIRASFNPTGLPASLGKQKRPAFQLAFVFNVNYNAFEIASTLSLASPKSIDVFSLKNNGF
ncbi:hypothetical protein CRN30_11755, partial [Vibrio vulnificus]